MGNVISGSFPAPKQDTPAPVAPKKRVKKTAAQIIAEAVAEDLNK